MLIGVVSGIVSAIFIGLFWQISRPRIRISAEIAKNRKNEYRIKIINNSRFFSVADVRFFLQVVKQVNGQNGNILRTFNVELPYPYLLSISPQKRNDPYDEYAVRLVLPMNLESVWKEDEHMQLKLTVFCSNEFHTSSRMYIKTYYKKNCIKDGEFECANSMKIVP